MELDPQKDFYDQRRYFQGKDNPTDAQPEGRSGKLPPMAHVLFGVLFFAFLAAIAWLRIRDEAPSASKILGARPVAAKPAAKK